LAAEARNSQVFINCPFSKDYKPLFEAIVFAVADCGFKPRCALEADDAGEVRFAKIIRIIKSCAYGVHDLSFMELDPNTKLARLNMSFELGLFLGARHFGSRKIRDKNTLVLDAESHRYQKAISDIAGQDIRAHGNSPARAIAHVRDWLQTADPDQTMPGGAVIADRYGAFRAQLPELCEALRLTEDGLTFVDLGKVVASWLRENA
jgi:hypothetical protein